MSCFSQSVSMTKRNNIGLLKNKDKNMTRVKNKVVLEFIS
jgi:hypothetical protein